MTTEKPGIILIGMPGAGKSTLGVQLAKRLALDFVDTDLLIQREAGCTLQTVLDTQGYLALRALEAQVILAHRFPAAVVATGGSAVYSDAAMVHLREFGPRVFLEVSLAELTRRIHDYASRGIAKRPEQSFAEVFAERTALYRRYADLTVDGDGRSEDAILEELVARLQRWPG